MSLKMIRIRQEIISCVETKTIGLFILLKLSGGKYGNYNFKKRQECPKDR